MTELVAKLSLAEERTTTAATIAKTFKDGGAKALKVLVGIGCIKK